MGGGGLDPVAYDAGISSLRSTGTVFARSTAAAASRDFSKIAEILDPRKLKNGMRESCFAPGFNDVTPIVVSIDGTGSMDKVPFNIQSGLPKLIEILTEKGISDHPNVLFMCHDDEHAVRPDAAFQMSQFEIGAPELIAALNEMIIPGQGGGNDGEAYHMSFYAAANHTRLESFERDGSKGFFFMICDEQPYYDNADPAKHGTLPEVAKEVFGDTIEKEVSMLESVKKVCERYHVFIIRPAHTSHGTNKMITGTWQKLLRDAGENPEHVLEIGKTEEIIPTIAVAIGRLAGTEADELADVLRSKGVNPNGAINATKALVPVSGGAVAVVGKSSGALTTGAGKGRSRR